MHHLENHSVAEVQKDSSSFPTNLYLPRRPHPGETYHGLSNHPNQNLAVDLQASISFIPIVNLPLGLKYFLSLSFSSPTATSA